MGRMSELDARLREVLAEAAKIHTKEDLSKIVGKMIAEVEERSWVLEREGDILRGLTTGEVAAKLSEAIEKGAEIEMEISLTFENAFPEIWIANYCLVEGEENE